MKINKSNLISVMEEWGSESGIVHAPKLSDSIVWSMPYFKFTGQLLDAGNLKAPPVDLRYHLHHSDSDALYGLNFKGGTNLPDDEFMTMVSNFPIYMAKNFGFKRIHTHKFNEQPAMIQEVFRSMGFQENGVGDYELDMNRFTPQ